MHRGGPGFEPPSVHMKFQIGDVVQIIKTPGSIAHDAGFDEWKGVVTGRSRTRGGDTIPNCFDVMLLDIKREFWFHERNLEKL